MKTLRVCLSSELPPVIDRSPEYIYFAYDKLKLYAGQNEITDNYAICYALPEGQIENMLYILTKDGSVHRKIDYIDSQIAAIEDSSMIELLKKAGTVFFVNADHRYLDSQRRSLTLPFNDGTYELNAAANADAVYDNNTILKFNEDTNRFELYSDTSEEYIDWSKEFTGGESASTKLDIENGQMYGTIKLSNVADNMLRMKSDGLYLKATNIITKDQFDELSRVVDDQKNYVRNTLDFLNNKLYELEQVLTDENVRNEITDILQAVMPDIQEAYDNYAQIKADLDAAEDYVVDYAQQKLDQTSTYITSKVDDYCGWVNL